MKRPGHLGWPGLHLASSMQTLLGIACVRVEELVDGTNEVYGARRCGNATGEDFLVGDILAVIGLGVVEVLVDHVAIEVDAGEEALVAGVGEEACVG